MTRERKGGKKARRFTGISERHQSLEGGGRCKRSGLVKCRTMVWVVPIYN